MKHHDLPAPGVVLETCRELGACPGDDFFSRLHIYLDLLVSCSRRMNLIGPGESKRLWGRHVMESVAFSRFLIHAPVVDVGSGAGFPGFVLGLLGFNVTMVEPREKRCSFLETAARECGLRTSVVCERVETAGPFAEGTQFTSRAVKKPAEMIRLIGSSAKGGFTLLIRVPDTNISLEGKTRIHKLDSPPLDRRGFILQYSHSD